MDENEEYDGQEQAQLLFDGGKKGHLFVIDYGEHMFAEGEWRFRLAMQGVRDEINQICCRGEASELAAVIFVNSGRAKNAKDLEYIYVHMELGVIDADYVKQLDEILATKNMKNELQPTLGESAMGDWSQIFYLIQSTLQFSGHVLRKKIVRIYTTDAISNFDMDSLEGAKTRVHDELRPKNIEIKVVLLEQEKEETEFTEFWKSIDPDLSRYTDFDKLIASLHFKNYGLRSATSLPFILGEGFQFSVGLYYLVKPQAKPSSILLDSETNERVEQRTHYIPKESNIDEIGPSDLIPGTVEGEVFEGEVNFLRDVGGVGVVMDREEFENLRRFDQPGITVIGFKPLRLLKDSHRMSPARFIYPLDKVVEGSSKIYKALLRRCLDRELFILVRYTQKTNTPPQLCAIVAQSSSNSEDDGISHYIYEGFHLIELPFAEESRNLREFGRYKTPEGFGAWPSASDEQITVACEFIDHLTWDFSPDQFANPVLQRHYKAVEMVALDLDANSFLEETDKLDTLKPYYKFEQNVKRIAPTIAKFKDVCAPDNAKALKRGRQNIKKDVLEEDATNEIAEKPAKRGRKKAT